MDKTYYKYMRLGKTVKSNWTEEKYYLIKDADPETGIVQGVNLQNKDRYYLLKAWLSNGVSKSHDRVEKDRAEQESYIEELKLADCTPANMVRFITPIYEDLFTTPDLGRMKVNDEIRRVNWLDEFHFEFIEPKPTWCYHICEFAEISKRANMKVEKLD